MGMIQCLIHDLTYIQPCCEHIGHAIEAMRYERTNVLIDTIGSPIALCDPCLQKAIRKTAAAKEWFSVELSIGVEIFPYCNICLKNWYAATGQGDFSTTIAEIKARSGSPPHDS